MEKRFVIAVLVFAVCVVACLGARIGSDWELKPLEPGVKQTAIHKKG